jgi:hypothetical protein
MTHISLEQFYQDLKSQPVYRSSIALEAAPSLPVPMLNKKELFAGVLILRTKGVEKGQVEIFRPEASLTVSYPKCRIARFRNFILLNPYPEVPADKPVDTFPHQEIADWTYSRLKEVRAGYFDGFPAFQRYLLSHGKEAKTETLTMVKKFLSVAEPGLLPFYLDLSPLFAALCIKVKPEIKNGLKSRQREDNYGTASGTPPIPGVDGEEDPLAELSRVVLARRKRAKEEGRRP